MPKKKRPKPFRAVKIVKEMARERIGTVPGERVVPNRKKKEGKYKPTLGEILEQE